MKPLFTIVSLFIILFISTATYGQGTLKGVVKDSLDNSSLVGANVLITGTAYGNSTDLEGEFTIARLPEGKYIAKISYIGYKTKNIPFSITASKITQLNIKLSVDAIETATVVVTAQALGQAAAINKQLTSNTITNVVSAEKIMELPDANAAESVGRLPGISIQRSGGEGNKVVIRGLSPTYNAITIGGDRIPSTDLDDRSVDLSMIAPEILAGIEVTKALTPDKDADALGGTVDFQLTTAPRGGFKANARFQNGYNNQRSEFGEYKGRLTLSNRFMDEKFGLLFTGNVESTQRGSDQFTAGYSVVREKNAQEEFAPITTSSVTFDHTFDVRKREGFSLMLDYLIPGGKLVLNNFLSRLDRDEIIRTKRFDWGGSNKLRYYLRDRQRQIDILTNTLGGEHDLSFLKMNWKLSRTASSTRYPYNSRFQFQQLSAFNTTKIPLIASPNDILVNTNENLNSAFLYDGEYEPERSYERDLSAQLNLEILYSLGSDIVGKVKAGAKYRDKFRDRDRDYASKRLDITDTKFGRYHSQYGVPGFVYERMPGTGYAYMKYYLDPDFKPENFLGGDYDFGVGLSSTELNYFLKNYLMDNVYRFSLQRDMDDYKITEKLTAGYIMTELRVGDFLMFMPGARYELTDIDATGKSGTVNSLEDEGLLDDERIQDTTAVIKHSKWFPMVHLRIKPVDWFDIRIAYTSTVSYPRLGYIIPSQKIKASEILVEYGNPFLKPQMATNYDVYFSLYGNRIGLFTVGWFNKSIDNLIYLRSGHIIMDPVKEGVDKSLKGYSITRPENNPLDTKVNGFEVEWQTNFKWLPYPFDGIVISANYSHIWSETSFPRSFIRQERIPTFPFIKNTVIDTFRTGKMPDQAADIANFSIGYDLGNFSGRVSMLLQGKTLTYVGVREELDGYIDSYVRWDMSLKYDITENIGVFYNLNNFTDTPDQSFMQTAKYATGREYYGWTMDLGLNIKL